MRKSFTVLTAVAAVGLLGAGVAAAGGPFSFGLFRDQQLANHSKDLFGVGRPLDASSTRLQWLLQLAPNVLLIPGTASIAHLRENLAAETVRLDHQALQDLDGVGG